MRYSFIILIALLASCSLEKRLAKYCPMCPDTIETVVEYRDTTIHDTIPGDSVTVIDSLYCDSLGNVYSIRISEKNSEILSLRTALVNNMYRSDCVSDTVIKEILVPGINKIVRETKKIEVPTTPRWNAILFGVLGTLILFLLIVLFFKRYRR